MQYYVFPLDEPSFIVYGENEKEARAEARKIMAVEKLPNGTKLFEIRRGY